MTDPDDKSLLDELFGDASDAPATSAAPDEFADEAAGRYTPPAPRESEERPRSRPARPGEAAQPKRTPRRSTRYDTAAPGTGLHETGLPESAAVRRGLPRGHPRQAAPPQPEPAPYADAERATSAGSGEGPDAPGWPGAAWLRPGARSSTAPGCREIGLTTTGFVIFVSVDSIMMYAPFRTHGSTSLLPQAITLLFLAFGLGALLVWNIRGAFRPVGVGMMLGWVFMTLISAGYLTGLNP